MAVYRQYRENFRNKKMFIDIFGDILSLNKYLT
jgi:hypothetical protein